MNDTTTETGKLSWWRRLSGGLKRTSSSIGAAVAGLVTKRKLDRAMLEQKPERGGRLAVPSQNQAAGGVLVQPMGEHRRPRQAEAQRVEGGLQIGAALGAAVHGQAGRLVDHQHQPVAVEHTRLDFFGRQFGNIVHGQDFRL